MLQFLPCALALEHPQLDQEEFIERQALGSAGGVHLRVREVNLADSRFEVHKLRIALHILRKIILEHMREAVDGVVHDAAQSAAVEALSRSIDRHNTSRVKQLGVVRLPFRRDELKTVVEGTGLARNHDRVTLVERLEQIFLVEPGDLDGAAIVGKHRGDERASCAGSSRFDLPDCGDDGLVYLRFQFCNGLHRREIVVAEREEEEGIAHRVNTEALEKSGSGILHTPQNCHG